MAEAPGRSVDTKWLIKSSAVAVKMMELSVDSQDYPSFIKHAKELSECIVLLVKYATAKHCVLVADDLKSLSRLVIRSARDVFTKQTDEASEVFMAHLKDLAKAIVTFAKISEDRENGRQNKSPRSIFYTPEDVEKRLAQSKKESELEWRRIELEKEKMREERMQFELEKEEYLQRQKIKQSRQLERQMSFFGMRVDEEYSLDDSDSLSSEFASFQSKSIESPPSTWKSTTVAPSNTMRLRSTSVNPAMDAKIQSVSAPPRLKIYTEASIRDLTDKDIFRINQLKLVFGSHRSSMALIKKRAVSINDL